MKCYQYWKMWKFQAGVSNKLNFNDFHFASFMGKHAHGEDLIKFFSSLHLNLLFVLYNSNIFIFSHLHIFKSKSNITES